MALYWRTLAPEVKVAGIIVVTVIGTVNRKLEKCPAVPCGTGVIPYSDSAAAVSQQVADHPELLEPLA